MQEQQGGQGTSGGAARPVDAQTELRPVGAGAGVVVDLDVTADRTAPHLHGYVVFDGAGLVDVGNVDFGNENLQRREFGVEGSAASGPMLHVLDHPGSFRVEVRRHVPTGLFVRLPPEAGGIIMNLRQMANFGYRQSSTLCRCTVS
ncbi:hypothetical protein [Embleya sp. NBC_00888]|uniref:hypothetical protein n=1 Tax=Embleya sp. NBC_00888 TaxID=2975960 RepID=UPI00386D0947